MDTMAERENETCWLFVDDSNVWIEAQKAAAAGATHLPPLTDRDRDPRLRINIGKLANRLCKGRIRGFSALYGSRPPPNDAVWDAWSKFDFETHIFDKNLKNKEKEVDAQMGADLVEKATELRIGAKSSDEIMKEKNNAIFIVITGDRDMIPPIKSVLKADIRVELWGWKAGMAKDYYRLSTECPALMSVHHLESEASHIFFTNTKSTRQGRPDPAKTLVLQVDGGMVMNEDAVSMELSQLQHVFYTNSTASKSALFVEFPYISNIENMLLKAKEMFASRCSVLSWPEYTNAAAKPHFETPLESRNRYATLTNEGDSNSASTVRVDEPKVEVGGSQLLTSPSTDVRPAHEQAPEAVTADDEGWQVVTRSDPANDHRRRQRHRQQCPDGIRCSQRGDCAYRHSSEERRIFDRNQNRDMRRWKTRKCSYADCRLGTNCAFAHSKEESWCIYCRVLGHCVEDCQWANNTRP